MDSYLELCAIDERIVYTAHNAGMLLGDTPALLLTVEGTARLLRGSQPYELQRGSLMLLSPGGQFEIVECGKGGVRFYILQFDCYRRVEKGRDHLLYRRSYTGMLEDRKLAEDGVPRLLGAFERLHAWHCSPSAAKNPLAGRRYLLEVVEQSLHNQPHVQEEAPITRAIQYIEAHYREALNRTRLAELTGYHPHYFSRKFYQETGMSVTDYITARRMREAKEKLLTTLCSVRDIAAQTGYSDALYFSRKFHRYTGKYPTEYRREPKRIVAYHFLGTLLQLGLRPIAAESHLMRYSYQLREELAGMTSFEAWDLDKLRSLAPELIVASNYVSAELRRQLAGIAPVLIQSEAASPLENLRMLGRLSGREQEAEQAVLRMQRFAAQGREQLTAWQEHAGTVGVYEISAGKLYMMGQYDRCCYAVYHMLGLRPPETIARRMRDNGLYLALTPDQFGAYAADHMIVCMYEEEGMALTEQLMASEAWTALPAVRSGQVYHIPIGSTWYNDGLSLERQMAFIIQLLLHNR